MASFKFRLKTLLALHESTRAQRRADLISARDAQVETASQIARFEETLRAERQRFPPSPGLVDIAALQTADSFASTLRSRVRELRQREAALTLEVERREQAVIEADREVRSLEKLRQRQLERHMAADAWLDARRLDDFNSRVPAPDC